MKKFTVMCIVYDTGINFEQVPCVFANDKEEAGRRAIEMLKGKGYEQVELAPNMYGLEMNIMEIQD